VAGIHLVRLYPVHMHQTNCVQRVKDKSTLIEETRSRKEVEGIDLVTFR